MKHNLTVNIITLLLLLCSPCGIKAQTHCADSLNAAAADAKCACRWEPSLYLKSNAAAWLMLVPNASLEWQVHPDWSVAVDAYYSPMDYFSHKVKFRTLSVSAELRWWFAEVKDYRFFGGAHFGFGEFNYATGGKYRIQDHNGTHPAYGGGLSMGARRMLGKSGRWYMELAVGAGAYRAYFDKFENRHNGRLLSSRRKTFYGIDRLAVSFGYRLGDKRYR